MKTVYIIILSAISLSLLSCSEKETKSESMSYQEKHRNKFHFSPEVNWMNDPNGMVYYDGEYHLFYQYYPDSTVWGPMHWGHAVSKDMVRWEHLPIALYPDSLGYIFSGSCVMDWNNTSGLAKDDNIPMIAIFTHHDPEGEKASTNSFQYQSIAYSNDKGRTWTKYAGNPVIPNTDSIKDFRDPKVIWDKDNNQWLMTFAAYDEVQFWSSPNLIDWTYLSSFGKTHGSHGGVWECPDLFRINIEGSDKRKWVLLLSINPGGPNGGSGTQYFVGNFDGKNFIPDSVFEQEVLNENAVWLDYGRDNYAGVTWSDVPESDGRRLFLGWMSNWDYAQVVPTEKWRSAMTLPRSLSLHRFDNSYRLKSMPVKELDAYRSTIDFPADMELGINSHRHSHSHDQGVEYRLSIDLDKMTADKFIIELSNTKDEKYSIGFDKLNNQFFSDRRLSGPIDFSDKFAKEIHIAPRQNQSNQLDMILYIDHASVELFADQGLTVMTETLFPSELMNLTSFISENGKTKFSYQHFKLKSIWEKE